MIKLPLYSFKTNYIDHDMVADQLAKNRHHSISGFNLHSIIPTIHHLELSIYDDISIIFLGRTKTLVDTGCSMTSISLSFYNDLNKNGNLTLRDPPLHITTTTCDGSENDIAGITTILVAFNAHNYEYAFGVSMDVLVIPKLEGNMILGLDFLSSRYVYKMTSKKIYYKHDRLVFSEKYSVKKFPINCPIKNLTIKANDSITIKVPFELKANSYELQPIINLLNIKSTHWSDNSAQITLENKTPFDLVIPVDKPLVAVSQLRQKSAIPKEEYMDDKEMMLAAKSLEDSGYFQPSLTSFIESRSTLSEFELIHVPKSLTDLELIKEFELDHLPPCAREQVERIIISNRPAFSLHKYDIGRTHVLEMDIDLINDQTPKIQKYHPIPLHARDKVKDILDQMEHHGIIRVCHEPSQYVSNIMVIPKKDKDSIRLLFDGRLLNYDTKRLPMAFVSKPEILGHLMDRNHLSSLDFSDAFFHIPLTEKAQPLTAFYAETNNKRMCFTRAPQGLKNSPLYLKILLDKIFQDLSDNLLFYVDDLLIATKGTLEEHFNLVELVLKRLTKAGLKLRPQKLLLARKQIQFLGMIFERNKLSIPEARTKAFTALPSPSTAKKLKSAICALSYYRHFIPNFSEYSRELMELASSPPKQFKFTEHHEKLFRELIAHICKNSSTYFPMPNKPFYVQTDASMYCAGGRLYQKDEQGNEYLIAAVSRTFTKTERHYTIYKKEALALLYTLRSMEFFIRYAPKLVILVDAKALTYIRLAKESTGILLRFSLELSKYEADIVHVPGIQNEISDLLSRQHKDINDIEAEIADNRSLSEKDSIILVEALTLPHNFELNRSDFFRLLNGPSPKDDGSPHKTKISKAKEGIKRIKNTPQTLATRKTRMPRLTNRYSQRPGVILPVRMLTRSGKRKLDALRHANDPSHQGLPPLPVKDSHSVLGSINSYSEKIQQPVAPNTNNLLNLAENIALDPNEGNIIKSRIKTKEVITNRSPKASGTKTNRVSFSNPLIIGSERKQFQANTPCKSIIKHACTHSPVSKLETFKDNLEVNNSIFDQQDNILDNIIPFNSDNIDNYLQDSIDILDSTNNFNNYNKYSGDGNINYSSNPISLISPPIKENAPRSENTGATELGCHSGLLPASQFLTGPYPPSLPRPYHSGTLATHYHDVETPSGRSTEGTMATYNRSLSTPVSPGAVESDGPGHYDPFSSPTGCGDKLDKTYAQNSDTDYSRRINSNNCTQCECKGGQSPHNYSKDRRDGPITSSETSCFKHYIPDSYNTLRLDNLLNINGYMNKTHFLALQMHDPFIANLRDKRDMRLVTINQIYHFNLCGNTKPKPILPFSLARVLINSHHYTHLGLHKSRAQITRDINSVYYIDQQELRKLIDTDTGSCHVCQLFDYSATCNDINTGNLPRLDTPRQSWSLDLITDLPKSDNDFKILILAVDDFSNYVIAIPLKDASSKEIIRAIKNHIFIPFGSPKWIRTDEQPSIYNSNEFYEFLKLHQVELQATAVASPFSNGRDRTHN